MIESVIPPYPTAEPTAEVLTPASAEPNDPSTPQVPPVQYQRVVPYVAIVPRPPRGLAITSMVLGIVGVVFALVPTFDLFQAPCPMGGRSR